MYIKWNAKDKKVGFFEPLNEPFYDNRSQYLYYYLNGFQINGNGNQIQWKDNKEFNPDNYYPIYRGRRKNVYIDADKKILNDNEWAFSKEEVIIKHTNKKKEKYGLEHSTFI
jgi:hypothetical protein